MKKIDRDFDRSYQRKTYEVPTEDVWSYPDKTYHLPTEARWHSRKKNFSRERQDKNLTIKHSDVPEEVFQKPACFITICQN